MNSMTMARGLGWFSIGLGMAEVFAPNRMGRLVGVRERPRLMRALGIREILTGIGALSQRRPRVSMWARVAGDVMDVALLASALKDSTSRKDRVGAATGAVLGVGLLDFFTARRLEKKRWWQRR